MMKNPIRLFHFVWYFIRLFQHIVTHNFVILLW